MRKNTFLFSLVLISGLILSYYGISHAYNKVRTCGTNSKCRIVDVLDRSILNVTSYSQSRVLEAWNQLVPRRCNDVADIVVGGTFGENGSPGSFTPAGFAGHLSRRCVIVVHYELEGPVIDAQAYEDSVEHGRKALAIVLNKVDRLRTQKGKRSRLRVWGHSKGAAILASTWRMEARNGKTKYITTRHGKKRYVNACPSNKCYYFGFGYPRTMEIKNRFSISKATGSMWSRNSKGKITKPPASQNQWWRLTTFTNDSDPIFTCKLGCAWNLITRGNCHRYRKFTRNKGYSYFDRWNNYSANSTYPKPLIVGNRCGD